MSCLSEVDVAPLYSCFAHLKVDSYRLAVPQQPKQWSLHDFELGHPLGKGKFGRVFVARTKPSKDATGTARPGYIIALKALYKDEIRKEGLELQVRRELEIQMNLRCVFCV